MIMCQQYKVVRIKERKKEKSLKRKLPVSGGMYENMTEESSKHFPKVEIVFL